MSNESGDITGDPLDQNSTVSTSYISEFERLQTFPLNWEHACSKAILAAEGFYCADNVLICAFCNLKLNASNIGGDLQVLHKSASTNCDFANGKQTQNIPLGNVDDFRVEKHRLISFLKVNWTAPVDPYDLAKWGFYYKGYDDVCRCPFCRLEVSMWEPGDRGLSEHQRWNPGCAFINDRFVGNIPLKQERSETAPRSDVTLIGAKHPRFASDSARLASYKLWPCEIQRPEELAAAGFYYTGQKDRVICFHCGGGLCNWAPNDDPWEEHAKWFSGCKYLHQMKNKSNSNKRMTENRADGKKDQPSKEMKYNRPKLFEEMERLKTFPKRWDLLLTISLLASSGFYYSGNNYNDECTCNFCDFVVNASAYDTEAMQAIHLSLDCDFANGRTTQNVALGTERDFSIEQHRLASLLSSDWPAPVDVYDLANWGLYYVGPGDSVRCFSCDVEFSGWNRGDRAVMVHRRSSPNCQFLQNRGINRADNLQHEHRENIPTAGPNAISAPIIQPNMATQGPTLEDFQGLHCRICLHRQIGALLLPCGHMPSCHACALNLKKCPFCELDVVAVIRTFI